MCYVLLPLLKIGVHLYVGDKLKWKWVIFSFPSEYLSDVRQRTSLVWWVLMWGMSLPAVTLVHGSEVVDFFHVPPLSLIWFLAEKYLREVHWIKSLEQLLISNEENWWKFCSACAFNSPKQTWKHILALSLAPRLQCGPKMGWKAVT